MADMPSDTGVTGPADRAIPPALYVKANVHQDQLTPKERSLLLSRGDLVGKALAQPDSLTADEVHELLGMPPPDVVHARIQRATRGKLSTVDELYAKAKSHPPPSPSDEEEDRPGVARLTNAEVDLLDDQFRTADESRALGPPKWIAGYTPGTELAIHLIVLRRGWHRHPDPESSWPPAGTPRNPMLFYGQDAHISGQDVSAEWDALPEDLKDAYRTRSEKFRVEAWIRFETALAEGNRRPHRLFTPEEVGAPLDDPRQLFESGWFDHIIPVRSYVTTGLKLFGDKLLAADRLGGEIAAANNVYLAVKRRWDALTDAQRDEYEAKAAEANAAIRAGYWARAAEACAAAEAAYKEGKAFYP